MTEVELEQIAALAKCTFSPGSTPKQFVSRLASYAQADHEAVSAVNERVAKATRQYTSARELSAKESAFLDRLAHQYRKQLGRCMSVACVKCNPVVDSAEVRVALDAYLEGRAEFDAKLPLWRKTALARYNERHRATFAHPYEYATKVAPSARRASTRGEVYCRFCGECLFFQVKQPHTLVKESAEAQRHLTICALQYLAGMRELAKPGHRAMPMEALWQT